MYMKKIRLSTKMLAVTGLALMTAGTAMAYQGDPNVQGPNYTPERHEAMMKAIETKDYQAWKELRNGRGRITQVINEDNFSDFIEMRELRLAGKTDEANQIREKLGLGMRDGSGDRKGSRQGRGYGRWQ